APKRQQRSVRHSEAKLPSAREASIGTLLEQRTRLRQRVRVVVLVVQQVERIGEAFRLEAAHQRDRLRDAHVDAMDRIADEVISRNDRAVRTQPTTGRGADVPPIAARGRCEAGPGAEEVQPAYEESLRQLE